MMKKENERIKIEFGDTVIEVPRGWEHISLSDYERICLLKPETKLEFIQYVADICKIEASVFIKAPVQLFELVSNAIEFIFKPDFKPCNEIEIDGVKYTISFADKLTLGEWVDFEAVIESDSETKLTELLAILCRPKGEKYDPNLIDKRIEVFKNLSCDKALPLISFFLLKKKKSEEILNHYLTVVEQAGQYLKDIETFAQNGDGIKRLPIWQRIRYYYLMKSLRKELSKFSDFSSINPTNQKPRKNNTILKNK